ncbi:enoyl-CoA hydratase family protein [Streptomyces sp. TS71-3]|uniref:enoyl-CoA hydratase family protein n=1 Tax=Streptomyces sp. TS71-3 TaxID=2733862 RepID=UPI001B0DBE08|nr:enoyl-CoA hydratase family protein [Streptomyces sp. TS71-3]GHJ39877.1 enoyl-CoA hydratase [Streptomyces sp. TS71-3]
MTEPLRTAHERGVAVLTLDDHPRRNALSRSLVSALTEALHKADGDGDVRAVVLTHSGSTFSAGADLKDPPAPDAVLALLRLLLELDKPVVARVTGHARAGGLGLLGACDIAVAGPEATFAFTEVRLGVAPALISLPLLPRLDARAASRYWLTGERFDAPEAARIGLLTAAAQDVDAALAPVLDGLRKAAPQALRATKQLVNARVLEAFGSGGDAMAALTARLFGSAEAREGMAAFMERRDPAWVR